MTAETPPETSLFARPVRQLTQLLTGSPDSGDTNNRDLPVTETLELLTPERRQLILEELAMTDQTALPTSTLAERVACAEYNCPSDRLNDDQRKRVYIALIQSHLPVLTDANVVTYDYDTKCVARGPRFSQLWRTYTAVREALS